MDDDNAMAFQLAGSPCPGALKSAQNAVTMVREWQGRQIVAGQAASETQNTIQAAALPIDPTSDVDLTE